MTSLGRQQVVNGLTVSMSEIPSSPVNPENGNRDSLRSRLIQMGVDELKALSELQAKVRVTRTKKLRGSD